MQVIAQEKYIRITPRKVRLVAASVRKLSPANAVEVLRFTTKSAAKPLAKAIKSAIADAVINGKLEEKKLKIKNILVEEGPVLKRSQPKGRGSAAPILKRSCHIKVILEG